MRYTTAFDAPPPVWERLAERGAGLRTLALDPYESRPPRTAPVGTVVSGWQFTNRVVLQSWSSPPDARAQLERLFGPPAAVEDVFGRSSTGTTRATCGSTCAGASGTASLPPRGRITDG